MTDALAEQERMKYEKLWANFPEYRDDPPVSAFIRWFLDYFQREFSSGETVIDFGCGTGRSASFLKRAHLNVHLIDLCDNCLDVDIYLQTVGPNPELRFSQACLWDLPKEVQKEEWGICFDVLEHIPQSKIDATLKGMADRIEKGGIFGISLLDDNFGEAVGEKLHLCIQPSEWWLEHISRFFSIDKVFSLKEEDIQGNQYMLLAVRPK